MDFLNSIQRYYSAIGLGTAHTSGVSTLLFTLVIATSIYGILKFIIYLKDWKDYLDQFKGIPGPDYHWLSGHLFIHPGPNQEGFDWLVENCNKYPKYHMIYFGFIRPVLTLNHPETAKLVLKTATPKQTSFGGVYNFFLPWLGLGLLISTGQQWARNRRLLTPAFHFDILKPYIKLYNGAADVLLAKWEKKSKEGKSIEIHKPLSLCTLDVMLQCAFSYHDDIQGQGEKHPYVEAVLTLGKLFTDRVFKLWMFIDFFYRLSANGRKYYEKCDYVHKVANEIISSRRKQITQNEDINSKRHVDFLDILLLACDDEGNGLSDLEIRQEVDTFLFEGHDTTASAISWFLYSMAKHPEYQTKCQDEIDSVFNNRNSDNVEFDDLNQIPFLQQCIKEALRLHSPVPFVGRSLSEPMEIEGKVFREGTLIDIPIYQIHHNKAVWGDDHMEYKPERFSPENINNIDSYDFVPFSAGPRNCIGQQFAMHEIKTIAIRVLRKFDLRMDESIPVRYIGDVVMRSENGIHVHMSLRSHTE